MNSYAEFYLTQGTSVNDLNGGGPSLGADDGPVYSAADFTVDGGATTVIVDNAATNQWAGCTAGDWLCWDTAGAKQYRRITVINGANATVDAACTAGANKAVRVGGAWASLKGATDILTALGPTNATNSSGHSPRLNIKYSATAYSESADVLLDVSFTAARRLTIQGYTTTAGDTDYMVDTTHRPIITRAATDKTLYFSGAFNAVIGLDIRNTAAGKAAILWGTAGDNCSLIGCRVSSTGNTSSHGLYCNAGATYCTIVRNVIEDCGGHGQYLKIGAYAVYYGNVIRNNGGWGMYGTCDFFTGSFVNNVVYGNASGGVFAEGDQFNFKLFINNIIADNGGAAIDLGTETDQYGMVWCNNIIADNTGAPIATSLAAGFYPFALFDYNCIHGNGADDADFGTYIMTNPLHNVTGEPWVETTQATRLTNADYRITAALRGAGFPGTLPLGGSYADGQMDMGPLQAPYTQPTEAQVEDGVFFGYYGLDEGELAGGGGSVDYHIMIGQ